MTRRRRRALSAAAIGAAVLAVLLMVVDAFTPGPGGATSSSYASAPDGLGAYSDLLAESGHAVTRLRVAPSRARLDPRETLVLLDPGLLLAADVSALRSFVSAGGRLVTGGENPGAWLSALLPDPPVWSATAAMTAAPLVPVPETAGVRVALSAGDGAWTDPRSSLPVLGEPGAALLTVATIGDGRVALLADSSPLQNRLLASADNAALGLALAGAPGRPVAFEEAVHGYGESGGLAALPQRWKWTLIGLALAACVGVGARIRRLGPPEPPDQPTLPPRRAHVEAIALALARSGNPGAAAEPVRQRALALVLERAMLAPDATSEAVARASASLGLDPAEIRALSHSTLAEDDVVPAGRALAKLSGRAE